MQDILVSWITDEAELCPLPLPPLEGSGTHARSLQRCARCDIPLGAHACPNPECRVQQAAFAETLVWGGLDHHTRVV
jgi:hypothetical protein